MESIKIPKFDQIDVQKFGVYALQCKNCKLLQVHRTNKANFYYASIRLNHRFKNQVRNNVKCSQNSATSLHLKEVHPELIALTKKEGKQNKLWDDVYTYF